MHIKTTTAMTQEDSITSITRAAYMTVDKYKSLIILKFVQSFIGMARKLVFCIGSINAHYIHSDTNACLCSY